MEDIRLAIGLIGFVSVGTFLLTYRLLKFRSAVMLDVSAVVIVAVIVVYVWKVWGQLWIVNYIPLPSVIVLANWFPPLLGALAAVVWLRLAPGLHGRSGAEDSQPETEASLGSVLRRLPVMLLIVGAAVYSVMYFIPEEPPVCGQEWFPPQPPMVWPVCRQTTPNTCSAASAATILLTLGIETTEQEMAQLCLTKSGTTWLGLYHGLSTKLLGTSDRVEFFEGTSASLETITLQSPILLCCQLTPEVANRRPEYERDGGWIRGTAHSVVYFGFLNGFHVVGDPSRGYEAWTPEELEDLWTGSGLRILRKQPAIPANGA